MTVYTDFYFVTHPHKNDHEFNLLLSCTLISKSAKFYIYLSVANFAIFYSLPKLHKPNTLFYPVVSYIDTTSYRLATINQQIAYLTTIFTSLLSGNMHTIKNSINFPKVIQNLPPNILTMVSFDLKSLLMNFARVVFPILDKPNVV